jgi:hypothetical protein
VSERADGEGAEHADERRCPRAGDEDRRHMNGRGQREALTLERLGERLVLRALESDGEHVGGGEQGEGRRRRSEGHRERHGPRRIGLVTWPL